jgi:hypothetical protein
MDIRTIALTLSLLVPAAAAADEVCDSPHLEHDENGAWIEATTAIDGLMAAQTHATVDLAESLEAYADDGWLYIDGWAEAALKPGHEAPGSDVQAVADKLIDVADAMMERADEMLVDINDLHRQFQANRARLVKVVHRLQTSRYGSTDYKHAMHEYQQLLQARQRIYRASRDLQAERTAVRHQAMAVYMGAPDVASIACVVANR